MNWLSLLMNRVMKTESIDFVVTGALPVGQTPAAPADLTPDEVYLSVRIRSLRLPNTRQKVVERIYGAVHAFAELDSRDGQPIKFATATMPNSLAGVDPKNLQNVLTIDKVVVGPTPWSGGDLALQVALFSVVSENLAGPFLETMTKLSDQVGIAFALSARPYVDVIKSGVEALTRAGESVKLEIGLDKTFSPQTGSYALVAAAVDSLKGKTLSVDEADGKLLVDGAHYTEKPYLVLAIESSHERTDWGGIPDLKESYAALKASLIANDQAKATELFQAFKRASLLSADLIEKDAHRLVARVDQLLRRAFGAAAVSSGSLPAIPDFHEVGLYRET